MTRTVNNLSAGRLNSMTRNWAHSVQRKGTKPDWVDLWDLVAQWDDQRKIVTCTSCGTELKNLSWAQEHAQRNNLI
jgi:hypothetical protein